MKLDTTYLGVLVILWTIVQSAKDSDVRNLLAQLFTTKSYDKLVRPIIDQSQSINVHVEYFLFSINDVSEVQQKLTTTGYLNITWKDEFLKWDPALYGDIEYLYIPQDNIWKPYISLQNGFKNLEGLGSQFIQVYVTSDGVVVWTPFQIFESECNLNLLYFPFDQPTCDLDFVAWSLDIDDIELFVGEDGINMDAVSKSNGQWDVFSSTSSKLEEPSETKVRYSITLKRKPFFVLINIIIPTILLAILNVFTFQIPANAGERMGYTISVWLSFAVFLTVVNSSLPKNSDSVPVISIYVLIQLAVGTITVIILAFESRIVCRSDNQPVSSCVRHIAVMFRRAPIQPLDSTDKININVSWKDGIDALDRLMFWILLAFLVVITFIALIIMCLAP